MATQQEKTRATLLSRVRDLDNHAAWREFDEKYRDLILRYCRRRGLQPSDAEDVRQMVMISLARQFRNFEYSPQKGRFRDYLGRVVANAIHRFFRRRRAEVHGLDMGDAPQDPLEGKEAPDPMWEAEWIQYHFRIAMNTVRRSAHRRSVEVFEHLVAGETVDQVAASFSMTRDAVHKIKQRMRDRLKQLIEKQIQDEDVVPE